MYLYRFHGFLQFCCAKCLKSGGFMTHGDIDEQLNSISPLRARSQQTIVWIIHVEGFEFIVESRASEFLSLFFSVGCLDQWKEVDENTRPQKKYVLELRESICPTRVKKETTYWPKGSLKGKWMLVGNLSVSHQWWGDLTRETGRKKCQEAEKKMEREREKKGKSSQTKLKRRKKKN